ncbi:hypothetical protein [Pectobacterium punjabense]|uniref:hypothetical protein n=1 Tax=Pectobacterium punjabense TaxID=2108399 RepID=UPI003809B989
MTKKVIFISQHGSKHEDVPDDDDYLTFTISGKSGAGYLSVPIEQFNLEGRTYLIARSCDDITDEQVKDALL